MGSSTVGDRGAPPRCGRSPWAFGSSSCSAPPSATATRSGRPALPSRSPPQRPPPSPFRHLPSLSPLPHLHFPTCPRRLASLPQQRSRAAHRRFRGGRDSLSIWVRDDRHCDPRRGAAFTPKPGGTTSTAPPPAPPAAPDDSANQTELNKADRSGTSVMRYRRIVKAVTRNTYDSTRRSDATSLAASSQHPHSYAEMSHELSRSLQPWQ